MTYLERNYKNSHASGAIKIPFLKYGTMALTAKMANDEAVENLNHILLHIPALSILKLCFGIISLYFKIFGVLYDVWRIE